MIDPELTLIDWMDGAKKYSPPRLTMWAVGKVMILSGLFGTSPKTLRGTTLASTSSEPMRGLIVAVSAKEPPSEVHRYIRKRLTPPRVPKYSCRRRSSGCWPRSSVLVE